MVSVTNKFVSIGNRRDKNLSDITDQKEALTNVLDTIIGDGTFVSEDLDFLDGLRTQKITPGKLERLANTTVKITQNNKEVVATPLVTIKDRVENARDVTGKVPANRGGLGLNARFIESTEVRVGNANSNGENIFIFNSNQIIEPNYWESGLFLHRNLFDASFRNEYGGIQWTGYFSPNPQDPTSTIRVDSTGLVLFEYDLNEANNWVKVVNFYAQTRPIVPTSSGTSTNIPINSNLNEHLSITGGDKLLSNNKITVTGVNVNQITLSDPITFTSGVPVSFTTLIGQDVKQKSFTLPVVEPGKEYIKFRISYWYPNNNQPVNKKYLYFLYAPYSLTYVNLYSELPATPPGPNEFRTFMDSALSPYNNTLGNSGVLGSNYKDLTVKRVYINDYVPKNALADLTTLQNVTLSFTNNSSVGTFSESVLPINIGNYIIPRSAAGTTLPKYIQVKSKLNDTQIAFKEKIIATTGSKVVDVVDHRGFIDWFYANSSGNLVTISSTSGLTPNNLVITNATSTFVRITSVVNSISFRTSTNLGLATLQPIYIYSEKGITDNSKTNFCSGVFAARLNAQAPVGNTLVVSSNAGIAIGQVVQFADAIPETPQMTTVTGIAGTTINLSANTTKIIANNSTITFAPAGTTLNKELCSLPFDTAPPFEGTVSGLRTVNRGLKSTAVGNFEVVSGNLVFVTNTTNITNVTTTATYNRKISIKSAANGNTYYIFASNTA